MYVYPFFRVFCYFKVILAHVDYMDLTWVLKKMFLSLFHHCFLPTNWFNKRIKEQRIHGETNPPSTTSTQVLIDTPGHLCTVSSGRTSPVP